MTRSMIATALTLVALVVTGCGASPTSGVPYKSSVRKTSTSTAQSAAASTQVGALTLQLSTLKAGALDLKLSGAGLASPLSRRLTAAELATTNKVAFENLPVGSYTVTMTAYDVSNKALGTKGTTLQVQASQPTELGLQLAVLNGALSFSTVDINAITASNTSSNLEETTTKPSTDTSADDSTEPSPAVDGDENGALGIEVVSKETVRKFLLFKKLAVTVKVTNHNSTETLSGNVKVDFYTTSGIIQKTPKLAETLVQEIQGLAPGKSVELTIQSTKSAVDAEATVSTVVSSATASTAE